MSIAKVDKFNNGFVVLEGGKLAKEELTKILDSILIIVQTNDPSMPRLLSGSDLFKSPESLLSELGQETPTQPINLASDGNDVSRYPVLVLYTAEGIKIVWEEPRYQVYLVEPAVGSFTYQDCPVCKTKVPVSGTPLKCIYGHTI